ncbi:hypothetical protein GCM10025857_37960 [Alicyclobacillus contaminans]|uniref:DUF2627 family protein n=1 Tax=Alicyclobacillus contaminans TaxID=392016 RepID=UPI0004027A13|nr:DUF2627 family protein [Alicyclobacillus contaminans]GMA52439.1 hypothetical protein GCM10025857_37960 [Alicyclobacillus contaminans]
MRRLLAWGILMSVFLLAGEGFNLFRVHILWWLAQGDAGDALWAVAGLLLGGSATAFLGGFIYHRDKKRGKLKKRRPKRQTTVAASPPSAE